ncbi:MAG: hypothetical protein ACP5VR_12260 [Acidimicrobiales bacterium]
MSTAAGRPEQLPGVLGLEGGMMTSPRWASLAWPATLPTGPWGGPVGWSEHHWCLHGGRGDLRHSTRPAGLPGARLFDDGYEARAGTGQD